MNCFTKSAKQAKSFSFLSAITMNCSGAGWVTCWSHIVLYFYFSALLTLILNNNAANNYLLSWFVIFLSLGFEFIVYLPVLFISCFHFEGFHLLCLVLLYTSSLLPWLVSPVLLTFPPFLCQLVVFLGAPMSECFLFPSCVSSILRFTLPVFWDLGFLPVSDWISLPLFGLKSWFWPFPASTLWKPCVFCCQ